jgi:hypothetical protein
MEKRIKRIHWFRDVERDVKERELHSVFSLPFQDPPKLLLGEPIQITIGDPDEVPEHYGVAQVVGIKNCYIRDLEQEDLQRQKPGFRSKKETIDTFRRMLPEYKSDINLNTEVLVVTLRRNSYDLHKLNTLMKGRRNVVVKKV